MKLFRLLALAGGAAYAYKRFFADSDEGRAETEAAQPFSSESLDGEPVAAAPEPEAS